ncbi:MAG: hypothetical protein WA785_09020 [Candidatus Acidiferrales bacterium]
MDLSPTQLSTLEHLHRAGYEIVAFPMYANYVGIRKANCAALLAPAASQPFTIYGTPAYLIGANFTVRVIQNGTDYFVWKKEKLEATPARLAELDAFSAALAEALFPQI